MTSAADVVSTRYRPPRIAGWLIAISLLLAGCSVSERPSTVTVGGTAFFSMPWQVRVVDLPAALSARDLQAELQAALDEANRVLSTYQPDTELMRFNQAPVGAWVDASPLLLETVRVALAVSAATDGRYDITVGPLVNLWGFGPDGRPSRWPDEAAVSAARARVGWQHLTLDVPGKRLRKQAAVSLDASSLGEGIGVQVLTRVLERHGIRRYLVSVAGVSSARGLRADGQPWRVAIESPDGSSRPHLGLALQDRSLSTSGSYRNYHEIDGVRHSHTIDPASGRPIAHRGVSVTVVDVGGLGPVGVDAWATALNVLGPAAGLQLANAQGLAAYFIEKTDTGFVGRPSDAFRPWLVEEQQP